MIFFSFSSFRLSSSCFFSWLFFYLLFRLSSFSLSFLLRLSSLLLHFFLSFFLSFGLLPLHFLLFNLSLSYISLFKVFSRTFRFRSASLSWTPSALCTASSLHWRILCAMRAVGIDSVNLISVASSVFSLSPSPSTSPCLYLSLSLSLSSFFLLHFPSDCWFDQPCVRAFLFPTSCYFPGFVYIRFSFYIAGTVCRIKMAAAYEYLFVHHRRYRQRWSSKRKGEKRGNGDRNRMKEKILGCCWCSSQSVLAFKPACCTRTRDILSCVLLCHFLPLYFRRCCKPIHTHTHTTC